LTLTMCCLSSINIVMIVMLGMVEGERPRGRPARRWSDDITDWCGCALSEAVQLASDRQKWRGVVGVNEKKEKKRCTNIIRGNLRQTY